MEFHTTKLEYREVLVKKKMNYYLSLQQVIKKE